MLKVRENLVDLLFFIYFCSIKMMFYVDHYQKYN